MPNLLNSFAIMIGLLAATCATASAGLPRVYYLDPSGRDTKDPTVCKFKGKHYLYYSVAGEKSGSWSIGIATSDNLRDWTFAGRLTPTTEIEQTGFCAPGAIVIRGQIHLFYQSYGTGPKDAILHAVSDDGIQFERDLSSPVFRPTAGFSNGRAIDAEVFPMGDKLLMYYATRDREHSREQMVGIAEAPLSGDFSAGQWKSITNELSQMIRPTVPFAADPKGQDIAWEEQCIEGPTLLEHKGRYYLFYGGAYNNRPQQIGAAVSDDGIHFRRLNNGRPLMPPGPKGSWNASESGHPAAFKDDDGRDYLFFQGDNAANRIPWHLSMAEIHWQPDPTGGPDVPVLKVEAASKP